MVNTEPKKTALNKEAFLIFVTNGYEAEIIEKMLITDSFQYEKKYINVAENTPKNVIGISFYVEAGELNDAKEKMSQIYDGREYAFLKANMQEDNDYSYAFRNKRRKKGQKRIKLAFLITAIFLWIAVELLLYITR